MRSRLHGDFSAILSGSSYCVSLIACYDGIEGTANGLSLTPTGGGPVYELISHAISFD